MAKAATNTGLLRSFKNMRINEVSICTPFRGESLALTTHTESLLHLLVDNNEKQVLSQVMSQDHESLENLLHEERRFAPSIDFAAHANAQPEI